MRKIFILFFIVIAVFGINAQEEIVFSPAALIPAADGYYVIGVEVDEDENGIPEIHKGCEDYYEPENWAEDCQQNHKEAGTQQEFTYESCCIMPTCPSKYPDTIVPAIPVGYIQMAPSIYTFTDSASLGAIYSPPLKNLVSLELALSADVSIQPGTREIPYYVDFSKDGGATWEAYYIFDKLSNKAGHWAFYTADNDLNFAEMVKASNEGPIKLRLSTNDVMADRPNKGQFVKVHSIKIVAEKAGVGIERINKEFEIRIISKDIISENGKITVYNYLGSEIGSGELVRVPKSGIYLVKSENNLVKKIWIN